MPRITVDFPDISLDEVARSPQGLANEVRLAAAMHWYSRGRISQGKAAEIAGLNRADFIDELNRRKVEVVQVNLKDLKDELDRG
ncbi:MAG TPA: UPF0175 family protein [Tepidisphaeraceae bacterium]|jgi:predicted HTH domain antitoxin|nr:UPF0175 family protein [Tepidisphaeraceae bacterium]